MRAAARGLLDDAMRERDGGVRDGRLASLERCAGFDVGFVRALRVELAPIECRDELALPMLRKPPPALRAGLFHAMEGHAIAARAHRVAATPRKSASELALRRDGLDALGSVADGLPTASYGGAIARCGVAAAWAALTPTDAARARAQAPLVIDALSATGVSDSSVIEQGLGWLALPHGWLAELDALRLPRVAAARAPRGTAEPIDRAATQVATLVEHLPSFFSAWLLDPAELASTDALRGFARRDSLPSRVRRAVTAPTNDDRALVAQTRLALALRHTDRRELDGALAFVGATPAADRTDATRLLVAVALSVRGWPGAAPRWFAQAPDPAAFDVSALDALASSDDASIRQLAVYDAGVLREIEAGALAGDLAPLRAQLGRYDVEVARSGTGALFLKDRHETLKRLLSRVDADDAPRYSAKSVVHVDGWPDVHNGSPSWRFTGGAFFAANRVTMVHRTLRRMSHRYARCFDGARPAPLELRFSIERDGTVKTAVAQPASADDADRAACVADVTRSLEFHDINFGVWHVAVQLR